MNVAAAIAVTATPVPIQQYPEELGLVISVFREARPLRLPCRMLEIGSLYGGTLYHWIANAGHGATVVSVDLPLNGEAQRARGNWQGWADAYGVNLISIYGSSHNPDIIEQVQQYAPYDFIFVDGDHYLPGVRQDFENFYPMLRPSGFGLGGCIAFHDICAPDNSAHIHVGRWWRKLVASNQYETQELIRHNADASGGIGLVWRVEE